MALKPNKTNPPVDESVLGLYWSKPNVFAALYGLLVVSSIVYVSVTRTSDFQVIALTALLLIMPIFFLSTVHGLTLLLIVRPIIDSFASYTVLDIQGLSLNMNSLLGLAVIAWGAFIILRDQIYLLRIPGMSIVIGLAVAALASFVVSIDTGASIAEFLRLASLPIFFVVAYHLTQQDPHTSSKLIQAVAISAIIPLLVAMWQFISGSGLAADGISNRLLGTFGHPNVLAFYMVIVLAVVGMRYVHSSEQHKSLLYPWVLAISFVALLFTYTRGAWVGLLLFVFISGLLRFHKALITALVLIGVLFITGQGIRTIVLNTTNYDVQQLPIISRITGQNEESDSVNWRLQVLADMAPRSLEQPILGYGIGNFVTLRKQVMEDPNSDPQAHNDYLRLAIELGFVGLGLYILLISTMATRAFVQFALYPIGSWQRQYGLIALGLITAFAAMSVSDNILQGTAVMWTLLAVLGTLLGLRHPHRW